MSEENTTNDKQPEDLNNLPGEEDTGPDEKTTEEDKSLEFEKAASDTNEQPENNESVNAPFSDENVSDDPKTNDNEDIAALGTGPVRVVGVKFRKAGKTYFFNAGNLDFKIGGRLIVETERGLGLVRVATPIIELSNEQIPKDLKRVIRKANWNDLERDRKNKICENDAFTFCKAKIFDRNLGMKLVKVEYLHDASKAIFYFTADQRVDFRELVKDLARELHTRIEMRQIGVRDESKMIGGLGPCGMVTCCSSFLTDFAPVSVRMAKDQNLAMNPTKVSGLCGRLMCCLSYEHGLYKEMIKGMPKRGKTISCSDGPCKVIDLNILTRKIMVELESGKNIFIHVDDIRPAGEIPAPLPEKPRRKKENVDYDKDVLKKDRQNKRDVKPKRKPRRKPAPGRPFSKADSEKGQEQKQEQEKPNRPRRHHKKRSRNNNAGTDQKNEGNQKSPTKNIPSSNGEREKRQPRSEDANRPDNVRKQGGRTTQNEPKTSTALPPKKKKKRRRQ